jgi:hypothetical protein
MPAWPERWLPVRISTYCAPSPCTAADASVWMAPTGKDGCAACKGVARPAATVSDNARAIGVSRVSTRAREKKREFMDFYPKEMASVGTRIKQAH